MKSTNEETPVYKSCEVCDGAGTIVHEPCLVCRGTGTNSKSVVEQMTRELLMVEAAKDYNNKFINSTITVKDNGR